MKKSVKLSKLVEELGLRILTKSTNYEEIELSSKDVNRPGLQLSGFMESFPYKRIQVIGNVEYYYYMNMTEELRYERFRGVLTQEIPCLIFSYEREITQDLIDLAKHYDRTVLISKYPTTRLISKLSNYLEKNLADELTIHAGLMEVFGTGVLIRGESSVGKSETALDLVTRGHRLVADDVVNLRRIDNELHGECPENIRHFMEIRGIGILDIRRLYGVGSVKRETSVDIIIELENWDENKEYNRLGLEDDFDEMLGLKIAKLKVPVKPGRNIAMIIEVAVRNLRQKNLGYNSAEYLTMRLFNDMNPSPENEKLLQKYELS